MPMTQVLLAIIGLSSGFAVAGGVFALVLSLKLLPHLAGITHTAKHIFLYEDTILLGAAIGNIISIFEPSVASAAGQPILLLFGLFAGMYTGCLAIALAEVLNVIPIMMRRAKMQKGSGIVLTMIALGKCVGTLAQFYFHWLP